MTTKERPILFSSEMVRAILAGKTQTRRMVKSSIADFHALEFMHLDHDDSPWIAWFEKGRVQEWVKCPYGQVGDRLWVREAWAPVDELANGVEREEPVCIGYRADHIAICHERDNVHQLKTDAWNWDSVKWRPSIHMPRWASRITLEITGVRVERLRDIREEDAMAEGVIFGTGNPGECRTCARGAFMDLWESINGAGSWAANPWVWVIEFKRIDA